MMKLANGHHYFSVIDTIRHPQPYPSPQCKMMQWFACAPRTAGNFGSRLTCGSAPRRKEMLMTQVVPSAAAKDLGCGCSRQSWGRRCGNFPSCRHLTAYCYQPHIIRNCFQSRGCSQLAESVEWSIANMSCIGLEDQSRTSCRLSKHS